MGLSCCSPLDTQIKGELQGYCTIFPSPGILLHPGVSAGKKAKSSILVNYFASIASKKIRKQTVKP
jgi:hypothetical protein